MVVVAIETGQVFRPVCRAVLIHGKGGRAQTFNVPWLVRRGCNSFAVDGMPHPNTSHRGQKRRIKSLSPGIKSLGFYPPLSPASGVRGRVKFGFHLPQDSLCRRALHGRGALAVEHDLGGYKVRRLPAEPFRERRLLGFERTHFRLIGYSRPAARLRAAAAFGRGC